MKRPFAHLICALFALTLALGICPAAFAEEADVSLEELSQIELTEATPEDGYFKGHEPDSYRFKDGELVVDTDKLGAVADPDSWVWRRDENGNYLSYDGSVILGAKRRGIDVSEWQVMTSWEKVKADDISFAIIRCGGTGEVSRTMFEDGTFRANVAECERLGIPYGIYYYACSLSAKDAKAEANYVLKLIKGTNPSYPVYYDLEYNYIDGVFDPKLLAKMSKTFCDIIEKGGYTPGVYASLSYWENFLIDPVFDRWTRWVAQYYKECQYQGPYRMWQATDAAVVDGIAGPVDLSFDYQEEGTFPDVPENHWGYKVIGKAVDLGLFHGYKNGRFGPSDTVTRGQAAVVLWNMAGKPKAAEGAKSFADVGEGAYYAKAVAWASSVGVVKGYGGAKEGTFGPNDKVTREQLAVMLANYVNKVKGREVKGSSADFEHMGDADSVSDYARTAVGWCFANKVLSGSEGNVVPRGNATRAAAAKMFTFVYELLQ